MMKRPSDRRALRRVGHLAAVLDRHEPVARVRRRMAELAGDAACDPGAKMVHDHLATGGKCLRARLALASCEALGGNVDDAIDWAAAVELLHNASLVHDDIQDGDRMRRGQPALWTRFGQAQAINAGDLLLMLPFRALRSYPSPLQAALVQILAQYAETTARGQIRELSLTAQDSPQDGRGWREYLAAASGKTGTLFALPVRGAAAIAGVEPESADAFGAAFASIGVLYQLQDDVLDLFDAKGRGRDRGSDLYQGRLSAVVLAHLELHPDEAETMLEFLSVPRSQKTRQGVAQLIARLTNEGAVEHLMLRIDALAADIACSPALASAPALRALSHELVSRVLAPLEPIRPKTSHFVHA